MAWTVRVVSNAAFVSSLIDDIGMAVILYRMEVFTAVFFIYFLQSLLYLLSFLRRRLFTPRQCNYTHDKESYFNFDHVLNVRLVL